MKANSGLSSFDSSAYSQFHIPVSQIPSAVKSWCAKAGEDDFFVLMFQSPYALEGEDGWINLQYSIQYGILGLDWVLLGPRNIEDQKHLTEFVEEKGHLAVLLEVNDVKFLRVEDDHIATLGLSILTDHYQIGLNDQILVMATRQAGQTGMRGSHID